GVEGGGQQVALEAAELSDVGGGAAPAGLGAAAQRPEPRAGDVGEDPGEAAGQLGADRGAVGGAGGDLAPGLLQRGDGPVDELGAMLLELDGQQVGVVVDGQPAQQGGLPSRSGAEVRPVGAVAGDQAVGAEGGGEGRERAALVRPPAAPLHPRAGFPPGPAQGSSQWASSARTRSSAPRARARAASWLPSSCTPTRPCSTRSMPPGSPEGQEAAKTDKRPRLAPWSMSSSRSVSPGRITSETAGAAFCASSSSGSSSRERP